MARLTLNIAKAYYDGFVEDIEKTKYFQLHKNETSRTDLYCFVIALAEMEGMEPTPITDVSASTSFLRTEYIEKEEPFLLSLYYDKVLKENPDEIDEICNRDEVYNLAERYANAGFGILKDWSEQLDEDALLYKLIGYMDKKYDEIKDEVNSLVF